MKNKKVLSNILFWTGFVLVVLSIMFGFIFANSSKHYYEIDNFEISKNQTGDFYLLSADISLTNNSAIKNGGTITLTLEDGDENRVNASFGNIEEFDGYLRELGLVNSSVSTTVGVQNGLGEDIKVVRVVVGGVEYDEKVLFNMFYIIPFVLGSVIIVFASLLLIDKKDNNADTEIKIIDEENNNI